MRVLSKSHAFQPHRTCHLLNRVSLIAIAVGLAAPGLARAQTAINLNALQGLVPVSVLGNTTWVAFINP
jgi:hypothetical protein